MTSTRVSGHALISEGAAHDDNGQRIWRGGYHGGNGRAKCSCGALSERYDSAGARKRWHRDHKAEVSK